jgi:hypothetical protein
MMFTIYMFEDVVCHACDGDMLVGDDVFCRNEDGEGELFCSPRCFQDHQAPDPDEYYERMRCED